RRFQPAGRAPPVVYAVDGVAGAAGAAGAAGSASSGGRNRKKLITSTQISQTRNTMNPTAKIAPESVTTTSPLTIQPSAITTLAHPNRAGNTPVRRAATPVAATRTAIPKLPIPPIVADIR